MTEENKKENNKTEQKEETCKCGNPLSECKCKDDTCEGDCKEGDDCCDGHDAGHKQPELTVEQMAHSLNVLMNALITLMVEKKIITEQELHEKLVKDFGAKPAAQ